MRQYLFLLPALLAGGATFLPLLDGAEDWETVLQRAMASEYSQTRQNALKQVDSKSVKGLKALWNALAITNPDQHDWFVREGAFEALSEARGEEAEKEILRVLQSSGNELA